MAPLLPELSALPVTGTFDGELVAFAEDGTPDFPLRSHITISYVIFDLLSLEGTSTISLPYWRRREELESLNLNASHWMTPETFDDGQALFEAVCERELEGIVAKRVQGRYRPGERGWVKIKNRDYWRYAMERESAIRKPRERVFV
jgi:bifunctional non-homologous end joining protein LigD